MFRAHYVTAVSLVGTAAIVTALIQFLAGAVPPDAFLLMALAGLSGVAALQVPSAGVTVSFSDTFAVAAAVVYGPAVGTLAVALDSALMVGHPSHDAQPWARRWFNLSASPGAMWMAAQVARLAAAPIPPAARPWCALVLTAAGYFVANSAIVAGAVALTDERAVASVWRAIVRRSALSYAGGVYAAVLLTALYRLIGDLSLLVLLPAPVLLYYALTQSLSAAEAQLRHHEATIEAFATAVDAKDHTTHGHIRRVQTDCLRLAARLGMTDARELRGLKAGALLHDVGKIAIPEHILNKPGRLTPVERACMETHAAKGAEILARIEFDDPVVPLVRHHHENWDGSGYPDGLRGTAIPVGARILQVVDCYDALTSDRPYRRRLPHHEAVAILRARRGTMYDATVVNEFIAMREEDEEHETQTDGALVPPPTTSVCEPDPGRPPASVLDRMRRVLADHAAPERPARSDARRHACLTGVSVLGARRGVFWAYHPARNQLTAAAVGGDWSDGLLGTRLVPGRGVSGWVAVAGTPLVDADTALEEGLVASDPATPRCLAVPVRCHREVIGVLTWYGASFASHDECLGCAIAESLGARLSHRVGEPPTPPEIPSNHGPHSHVERRWAR